MIRTVFIFFLALLPQVSLSQLHQIIAAEYFFDSDPGPGSGIPIALVPDDVVQLDGDISTSGLSPGVHVLNVRVQREDGIWGEATKWHLRIGVATITQAAEVYFDTDPGAGNAVEVDVDQNGLIDETAFEVPDLARGFHTLNLRTYSGGTWSANVARPIRLGSALIDGAEAYFDTDPGEGSGTPVDVVSGADVIAFDSTVNVGAAGSGIHNLYLRFRGGGVWSFPVDRVIRVGLSVTDGVNRITGGEFFIDMDPGEGNGCALIAEDGVFDETEEGMRRYVESNLSLGQHVVGVRVKDAGERWHIPLLDTVHVIEAHLVATTTMYEGITPYALLSWNAYPEAILYRVHYDSLETGPFTGYISVSPPDTSLLIEPAAFKRLFKVVALQIEPEPCEDSGYLTR